MSGKNRHRAFQKAEPNVLTTAQTAQPIQEKTMEASQEKNREAQAGVLTEPIGPTAKEMAAAEEANSLRARKLSEQANTKEVEPVPIAAVAARGYDALHEAFAQHAANNKPREYIPPPRTPRQMAALEEELEAGRRSQEKAQAQADARPVPVKDPNEGFITPTYRPGNLVPDPTIPSASGYVAGTKEFSRDA